MSSALIQALKLGSIEQVAYVVKDMEEALPAYEALFGPFEVSENHLPDCTYRGQAADMSLKMAVNNAGPIEIELLQPVDGESPLTEHLREHGEGLHHVRFRVDGIDERMAIAADAGFETLLYKRFSPEVAFAYLRTPPALGGHVIEFLEMP